VQSIRLASGEEALVARVLGENGKAAFGFSFRLDAAEARYMAEWQLGARTDKPRVEPVLGHPWERALSEDKSIPWELEPGFNSLRWLP
jgi:hypothetical protein